MPIILWREQMSVGVPEIDADHKRFISYLNTLDHAVTKQEFDMTLVGVTLLKIVRHTEEHFPREEVYLEQYQHSNIVTHRNEHEKLRLQLRQLYNRYLNNPSRPTAQTASRLARNWLVAHIIDQRHICLDACV